MLDEEAIQAVRDGRYDVRAIRAIRAIRALRVLRASDRGSELLDGRQGEPLPIRRLASTRQRARPRRRVTMRAEQPAPP